MTAQLDTQILHHLEQLQPPDEHTDHLPSVGAMYTEMKRVALKGTRFPQTEQELDDLLQFVFHAAYSHALTLQLLLQTRCGQVAEKTSTLHAAETISHIKKFRTYAENHPVPLKLPPFEVDGKVVAL